MLFNEFCEIYRNTFLIEYLWWLLLYSVYKVNLDWILKSPFKETELFIVIELRTLQSFKLNKEGSTIKLWIVIFVL